MSAIGGSIASPTPAASSTGPSAVIGVSSDVLASPFKPCAGAMRAGRARRQPAADDRGGDAERAVHQRRDRAELQLGRYAGEVAAAEVAAEQAQRERGERRADGEAGRTADRTEQRGLDQHEAQPLARTEPEHAEQRELRLALRDRQREDREHQERAGEEGDQREHRQVHAVGARHVRDALRGFVGIGGADAGRQRELAQHRRAVRTAHQPDVDAVEAAEPAECGLRAGDVDHRERRPGRGDAAADPPFDRAARRLHPQRYRRGVRTEPLLGLRIEKHRRRIDRPHSGSARPRRAAAARAPACPRPAHRCRGRAARRGGPAVSNAAVSISTIGLATATRGCAATRAYSASSKPAAGPRSSKSGSPLIERTAALNSPSADWLIRWTENASATPSSTAMNAAPARHG